MFLAIGLKACIYYHLCCVGVPTVTQPSAQTTEGNESSVTGPTVVILKENNKSVHRQLGLIKNDIEIIEHLAEIVKEQQQAELSSIENTNASFPPSFRVDSSTCSTYRNSPKK